MLFTRLFDHTFTQASPCLFCVYDLWVHSVREFLVSKRSRDPRRDITGGSTASSLMAGPLLVLASLYFLTEILLQYGSTAVVHMTDVDPDRPSEVMTWEGEGGKSNRSRSHVGSAAKRVGLYYSLMAQKGKYRTNRLIPLRFAFYVWAEMGIWSMRISWRDLLGGIIVDN